MKAILRLFIRIMDYFFHKRTHCEIVPFCQNQFFYINTHPYKGVDKQLKDGTYIKNGDQIIEVHINNQKSKDLQDVKVIIKSMKELMHALSKTMQELDRYKGAKAVFGNTLLYVIANKFGFEVHEVDEQDNDKNSNFWENLIKYAYNEKHKKIQDKKPKEIWYSKESLIERYKKQ